MKHLYVDVENICNSTKSACLCAVGLHAYNIAVVAHFDQHSGARNGSKKSYLQFLCFSVVVGT